MCVYNFRCVRRGFLEFDSQQFFSVLRTPEKLNFYTTFSFYNTRRYTSYVYNKNNNVILYVPTLCVLYTAADIRLRV